MGNNPVPYLCQSGCLTIKGYNRELQVYGLGFSNKEVEEGLYQVFRDIESWKTVSNS